MSEPQIPGFNIEKRLGRGGMASVYLATQVPLNRKVALKIMSNQLGEDSVWAKRFIQEAQVIAQLTHPNVVPVYDVGTHDGSFYIAMENLSGGSLKDRMRKGIAVSQALKIIVGVAAGLDYAGEKGFVHRDIKPDNIMFRDDGSPVILDFGIVKQMDSGPSQMTQTGVIVGTTSYMSPEQAQGKELDQRSDIYATGIMFYELLTGKPPYKGDTDVATLLMHINDPVPRLNEPLTVFQPIIDKALAKDPFHRYTRAREMIEHIQQLEPKIKQALAKIQVGNASDPTMVKTAVARKKKRPAPGDDDATMVMQGGTDDATIVVSQDTGADDTDSHHTSQITNDELTQVLSSARATIRDFSAESRAKKARRTKSVILGLCFVAVCAIGYVGFNQFYLVPKERAAAEAKIQLEREKTQRKIDSLLAEANQAKQGLLPSNLEGMDNVIAIYRQILKLDPENADAEFALERFGDRYIELSRGAVRKGNLSKAETYRDYAEQLVPDSGELPGLRQVIKSLRSEKLDKELVKEELNTLIAVAKTDLEKSDGFSDTAYTKLQQVLRLDPENLEAQALIKKMLEGLYVQTQSDISKGRLSKARENVALLEKYYDEPVKVAELDAQLNLMSTKLAKQQSVKSLIKRAQNLEREKRTISVNDELRETYLSILKHEPRNSTAKQGLLDASAYDNKIARQAIEDRDIGRAEKQLAIIKRTTPSFSELASLEALISRTKNNMQQASVLVMEASSLISKPGTAQEKQTQLKEAGEKLTSVKNLDPKNPKYVSTLARLESAYLEQLNSVISSGDDKLADAYFADAGNVVWPSDRILQMQLSQKKSSKKPKRVITGGF